MLEFKTTTGITEKFLKNKYPEYLELIFEKVKESEISISERIWLYQNNMSEKPKCLNCDNKVKFIKFYKGYRKFCSKRCSTLYSNKDEDVKKSRTNKMLSMNYDAEARLKMTEKANLTKSKFSEEKKESINRKREDTNLEKYGVKNISKNEEIKKSIVDKLKKVLPDVRKNKSIIDINKTGFTVNEINGNILNLKCPNCLEDFDISRSLFNSRKRFEINICLKCNPNNNESDFKNKVSEFISDNYKGEILNKYKKFKKYEIDIFLPELKIGFECNGLWWHSEKYKENDYHINKTKFFEKEGIKIIHIWEDDWKFKRDILKSRICNILNLSNTKLFARNCEIKEINSSELSDFLIKNHLQGKINSKIKIGLIYEGRIVSVMSFGNLRLNLGRKGVEGEFELLRFCSELNTNVIGSASKLFNYFIKKYNPNKVISYASIDWSSGNLYQKLGFNFEKITTPNYFYFHKDDGIRLNRFGFRKDQLIKQGYDPNMTEHDIMISRDYYRIYDSGSLLYTYDNIKN